MRIKTRVNFKFAGDRIRKVAPRVQQTTVTLIERSARLAAISCAYSTQPYGTDAQAKTTVEKAVVSGIRKIYFTARSVYGAMVQKNPKQAAAFYSAIKRRDIKKAEGIMRGSGIDILYDLPLIPFDGGTLHKKLRDPVTGRVAKNTQPQCVVIDSKALDAYIQLEKNMAGFGKGAWANLARELGSIRGLKTPGLQEDGSKQISAGWITRHRDAPFFITRNYANRDKPVIILISKVRYASEVLPEKDRRQAEFIAMERLLKNLKIAVKYDARMALKGQ